LAVSFAGFLTVFFASAAAPALVEAVFVADEIAWAA
jgi:hypothetical protein